MPKPYASAIIKLLQSRAVYDNDRHWQTISQFEIPIRTYFEDIGISLDFNRSEGYARITQQEFADDEPNQPIKLIRRNTLTYEQSLMAIVLREWLDEHEGGSFQSSNRLFVSKQDLRNRIELFFKDQNNKKALANKLDGLIEKMVDNDFLKIIQKDEANSDNTRYEVKTLVKIKISNEKLETFKAQLQQHVGTI